MKSRLSTRVVLALSVITASQASGQQLVHLGVGAGLSFPASTFQDQAAPRENILVLLTKGDPESLFGFRLDYSYNAFEGRSVLGKRMPNVHMHSATANILVPVPFSMEIKPYAFVGGGGYRVQGPNDLQANNHWGVDGGGGVTFPCFGHSAFLEGRYHRLYGRTSAEQFMPVTFGLLF